MDTTTSTNTGTTPQTSSTAALEAVDVYKSLPLGRERIDILKGV